MTPDEETLERTYVLLFSTENINTITKCLLGMHFAFQTFGTEELDELAEEANFLREFAWMRHSLKDTHMTNYPAYIIPKHEIELLEDARLALWNFAARNLPTNQAAELLADTHQIWRVTHKRWPETITEDSSQ